MVIRFHTGYNWAHNSCAFYQGLSHNHPSVPGQGSNLLYPHTYLSNLTFFIILSVKFNFFFIIYSIIFIYFFKFSHYTLLWRFSAKTCVPGMFSIFFWYLNLHWLHIYNIRSGCRHVNMLYTHNLKIRGFFIFFCYFALVTNL